MSTDKTFLFLDLYDTWIANCGGGFYEMRPQALTIINELSNDFQVYLLTHLKEKKVKQLFKLFYAKDIYEKIIYANWDQKDQSGKFKYIKEITKDFVQNWYWIEDLLSVGNQDGIPSEYRKYFLSVDPEGINAFTNTVNKLYILANKENKVNKIKRWKLYKEVRSRA